MAKDKKYSELLRDPRWQKMRLKIMERDGFKCLKCKMGDLTLNVHHKKYFKSCDPWDYDIIYLETLCEPCHKGEHKDQRIAPEKERDGLLQKNITSTQRRVYRLQEFLKQDLNTDLQERILNRLILLQRKPLVVYG